MTKFDVYPIIFIRRSVGGSKTKVKCHKKTVGFNDFLVDSKDDGKEEMFGCFEPIKF
jgi:hypothetical protein